MPDKVVEALFWIFVPVLLGLPWLLVFSIPVAYAIGLLHYALIASEPRWRPYAQALSR